MKLEEVKVEAKVKEEKIRAKAIVEKDKKLDMIHGKIKGI